MKQDQLFQQMRWRLACWYTGAIGVVLVILGAGVYEAIVHAHRITIKQELKTVAGTVHDSLQPALKSPGKLSAEAIYFLPNLCWANTDCMLPDNSPDRRMGAMQQGQYYLQLYTLSRSLVALAGIKPEGLPQSQQEIIADRTKNRYIQTSLILQTEDGRDWGYLQIGRSLKDFDDYLRMVGLILLLGVPLAVIMIAGIAWWLARLAMQPVYQSYQQIQQFTGDAAHELRTPLAAIRATIESVLMLPTLQEREARETLQKIERQNQRLSDLVADLLMLSRMDWQLSLNSQQQLKQEAVCLQDLVSDIAEELASLALASSITLGAEIRVRDRLEVMGNAEQLYRLVSNLVINGIQYTSPGGVVMLRLERDANYALIHVEDNGVGISPEEKAQIFDRFYRVNKARSKNRGGFGLGLSIAGAIAQVHQGAIAVQSQLGQGSTFTIRLPANGSNRSKN